MTLKKAKNIKIGDIVALRFCGGEYEITDIDEQFSSENSICFRSNNLFIRHKEIDKVVS